MARFNTPVRNDRPDTVNHAGGEAYRQSDRLALVSHLLTSFLEDQYYRSAEEDLEELVWLISRVDPLFAAKAAVYARREFGMRSVTHVVAGELAAVVKGEDWTRSFIDAVVVRPDDVTEILGYYASAHGLRPLPNSLKKGLAGALRRFDEYQLAKYRGEGRAFSLVDAVNLCHPRPTAALTRLMTGDLPPADTWEVALTRAGQQARDEDEKAQLKLAAWRRLLGEDKLGYFALLRNLRSLVLTGDAEVLALAERKLVDADAIRGSRVFPFRILAALHHVRDAATPGIVAALEAALELAFANVPRLPGRTLVAVDASGSMLWRWRGWTTPLEKAVLAAAALVRRSACDIILFSDGAEYVHVDPAASLATTMRRIRAAVDGGGTDFTAIFECASRPYDRVVILSDMQAWMPDYYGATLPTPALRRYCRRVGADPAVFCFDLTGYGTAQFPERKVFQLAGFSDKAFDLMAKLESDRDALVGVVEEVDFTLVAA